MNLPKNPRRFISHFIRMQWIRFLLVVLFSLTWAANDSIYPYFIKRIVNTLEHYHGAAENIYAALSGIIMLLALFWILSETFLRIQGFIMAKTFPQFRANIRFAVFDYVKCHSHEYFSNHFAGNIAKKLADLPTSCQVIMEIIIFNFVTAGAGALIVFILMWSVQPVFAFILLGWLTLHLSITLLFLRISNHLWEKHADAVSVLSGKIVDVFTNMMNVRLFAREKFESRYLEIFQRDEIKKASKAMYYIEYMRIGLGVSGLILIFSMLFFLLRGYTHRWVTLGDFTQIGMQTFWLLGWIWHVSFQLTVFARELGTVSDSLTLIAKSHDLIDDKNAKPIRISQGKIIFDQVSFAYQKKKIVFDHFNVEIPAGQKVGLVGFSGSGKSTFVNLILRFYDLKSGRILIDGQDIAKVTQASLHAQIAMIPQDPSLFHRTLMENIRYGRLEASDEEVIRAAQLAHCDEFIERIDEKYQALVGERGIKLSGGQRQRIAIARAILKNAPILILDEATSSLDSVTEKLIQESLHQLMQGRTTIVVAHRLSTLADMDRILVFHKGKIIEDGTQESLLKADGHFAMLWNMQIEGFLPETE